MPCERIGLFLRLMKNVPDPELRQIYRRRMTTMLRRRPDPNVLFICVLKCAMHYHHYTMARQMVEQRTLVNTFYETAWGRGASRRSRRE